MSALLSAVPEPVLERVRLVLARRLETRARRSPAVAGAALVIHAVGAAPSDPDSEIDPTMPEQHLDALVGYLRRRYTLVRAAELPAAAHEREAGAPLPIALTFDDDIVSHRERVAPILARHGVVATAFLCGARAPFWWQLLQLALDKRAIEPTALAPVDPALVAAALERRPAAARHLANAIEDLEPRQRDAVTDVLRRLVTTPPAILDERGAADLADAGWELGFHTRRHDVLPRLDDAALRAALTDGRPAAAHTLAYPHGKAGPREAGAARDAGYVAAYTGRAEVFARDTDPHLIGRLQPGNSALGQFVLDLARALSVS